MQSGNGYPITTTQRQLLRERQARQQRLLHAAARVGAASQVASGNAAPVAPVQPPAVVERNQPPQASMPKEPTAVAERVKNIEALGAKTENLPLPETPSVPQKRITVWMIQNAVARDFGIEIADIRGPKRRADYALPRHVAVYFAKRLTARSFSYIGSRFGNRDHTTVLHSFRRIEKMVANDPGFASRLASIEAKIKL